MKKVWILNCLVFVLGCGNGLHSDKKKTTYSSEESNCSTVQNYADAFTLNGSANYTAWVVTANGLSGTVTNPIRRAEVRVLNSAGAVVQCGSTDNSGNYSVQVGKTSGVYRVQVNSRADNDYVKLSVLNNPSNNLYYTIETTVTYNGVDASVTASTLNAPHTGTISGGAFNIFDQILNANDYLRSASTACGACTQFTVAPKLRVYWTAGFNPNSYFGAADVGLSFYSSSESVDLRELYILGGLSGDTDNSDTDHFDNSIILHEYGHYLENVYAGSDSQGGHHNGNFIIDPRLAWSEGWANFVEAAVQGAANYRDTIGNPNGQANIAIDFNLEAQISGEDVPSANGEGVYRELAISRALYDTIQTSSSTDESDGYYATVPFGYLWTAFAGTNGLLNDNHFRNSGLFHKLLRNVISTNNGGLLTNYDNVLAHEKQSASLDYYAAPLSASTCSAISITGVADSSYYLGGGQYEERSNQLRSNDFYLYYHAGGVLSLTLNYTDTGALAANPDLDLYVFKEDYDYDDPTTLAVKSNGNYPENGSSGIESVSANLAAGYYMVNVRVYTTNKTTAQIGGSAAYTIYTGGTQLCP